MSADITLIRPLMPAGACDCHSHIFGPQRQFPYMTERRYTPADATIEQYQAMLASLGLERGILVQGSVHGTDNSAMLSALTRAGKQFRGIAMVTKDVTDAELQRLHDHGVRGIRTQLRAEGGKPLNIQEFRDLAHRIAPLGWHVEVHADVSINGRVDDVLADFPVPVVVEHMGRLPPRLGVGWDGFQRMLRLLESPSVWVKFSGVYITSEQGPPYDDMREVAEAVLSVTHDRVVWGSNWPHPHQETIPDDGTLLGLLFEWSSTDVARKILADNPARLYGFE